MRNVLSSAIAVSVLTSIGLAQVNPGLSRAPAASKLLTTGTTGNTIPASGIVNQVSFQRLSNNTPGKWTCCVTVSGLSTTWGGVGGNDLLIGILDRGAGTFTPTKEAAALNISGGGEFGLMIDPTGKYALFDRNDGPKLSIRSGPGVAFPAAVGIGGFGLIQPSYIDPAPVWLRDSTGALKLHMAWVNSNGVIVANLLNLTNPSKPTIDLTKSIPLVRPKATGGTAHSPTPIHGPDGEGEGMLSAEVVGAGLSDMMWSSDLNPATPSLQFVKNKSTWLNNGGITGGMFHWANSSPAYHIDDAQGAWLLGDVEAINGRADVFGAAFKKGPTPVIVALFWSGKLAASALAIPGFNGLFGLDLGAGLQMFGAFSIVGADERGTLPLRIPNDATFKGANVPVQGVAIDPVSSILTFTNTAFISVRR